jgi:DNA-binding MarR family transcriptional regulator
MEGNEEYDEALRVDHQMCFKLYLASRLTTKLYKSLLTNFDLTYPQYLVMLVLWETDNVQIKTISQKLYLNTNTLTPLLKRMEARGLISRTRSQNDERQMNIKLTEAGQKLKADVKCVTRQAYEKIFEEGDIRPQEVGEMKMFLDKLNAILIQSDSDLSK